MDSRCARRAAALSVVAACLGLALAGACVPPPRAADPPPLGATFELFSFVVD